MAITVLPIFRSMLLPMVTGTSVSAFSSTFRTARSMLESEPATLADTLLPSGISTWKVLPSSMTW